MGYFHNGYLGGDGNSAFAAHADHAHEGAAQIKTAEVKTTDWTDKAATVAYSGTFVGMFVDIGSTSVASTAKVVVTSAAEGVLTLGCTDNPASAITIYILTV